MGTQSRKRPGAFWFGAIIGVVLAIAIAVAVAFFGVRQSQTPLVSETKPVITSTTIKNSFDEIAELSVEEYNFTNVGEYRNEGRQILGRNVPLTGKSFLVTYDGTVKAGVKDLTAASVSVDNEAQVIHVEMPHAEITSAQIDRDSAIVYDQTMNPINQIEFNDVNSFMSAETDAAEQKAIEAGLLQRAETRLEQLVETNIHALAEGTEQEGYPVEFVWN